MLETSITLDDKDGTPVALQDDDDRIITSIEGLTGVPGIRDVSRDRPNSHGSIDETKYLSGRVITVNFEVTGDTDTACWSEWDAMVKPMMQTLDYGPALLKWQRADSSTSLQCSVRLIDFEQPVFEELSGLLRSQVSFRAEDPRNYSQTQTTAEGDALSSNSGGAVFNETFPVLFSPSGGGTASFTNSGNAPGPVTLTINGECSAPQVLLVETDERMVFTGSVAAGDTLVIDTHERTVLLNGTTSRLSLLDYENTDGWLLAPPGTSTWRLLSTSFDGNASLDVAGRSAFL